LHVNVTLLRYYPEGCNGSHSYGVFLSFAKGFAVTFIVHAIRGEEATTTIRLNVVAAIARGRALAEEGWRVFITAPDGGHFCLSEFDKLLSIHPAL
jgi:hypothetical protein